MKKEDEKEKEEEKKEEESPPTLEVNVYDSVVGKSVGPGQLKK
jgi:hypothetical protein